MYNYAINCRNVGVKTESLKLAHQNAMNAEAFYLLYSFVRTTTPVSNTLRTWSFFCHTRENRAIEQQSQEGLRTRVKAGRRPSQRVTEKSSASGYLFLTRICFSFRNYLTDSCRL
jgi:hypothetical protein